MAKCETCGQTLPDDEELTIEQIKAMRVEEVAARLDEVNEIMQTKYGGGGEEDE